MFADDAGPERLELKPSSHVRSNLLLGEGGADRVDLYGSAGGFGHQLGLAASFHGDEPPGGFVDGVAHGQQAMIAQDDCFPVAQGCGNSLTFGSLIDDSCEVCKQGMIVIKGADVLGDGIEQTTERRPGLSVQRMGMSGGDDIGARGVDLGVNGERPRR